ncbi:MAG: hypothetical protein OFPII_19020 [Osedax symbiont Rs1]|nr:MAG: hypothetical protein OFPII_19020 [Osedax symbiont Rs1]
MLDMNSVEYRQAALSLNYELEAIFRKNINFFKIEEPNLYQLFKNYTPKILKLRLAAEGYLNLYNINSGKSVYDIDPLEYAKKQVELHLKTRPTFALNLTLADNGRDDYPYTKCLSKLDIEYDKIYPGLSIKDDPSSQQMFMFGGGLFLQLEPLLNQLDVKHLSIFESNHDSFHASMHLIDWSEIYRYFSQDGYSLNFNLIGSDQTNLVKMAKIYLEKGFHHFTRIEQYYHYSNDEILNLINNFKNHLQSIIGSQGFFEDERIGMAHTLINISKNYPICSHNFTEKKQFDQTPVIIVGNGPSLDDLESFIFDNKDNAIIVSCGSALSALIKKGIKPDIHIEQERMILVPQWIEESTTMLDRKGIVFIGLNPCHPRSFELFDESYITLKPHDLGVAVMEDIGIKEVSYSDHCLPVVGNLALSVMINMGYKNIYLAGLDCGMIGKEEHHSKDSNYFNADSEYNQHMVIANVGDDFFEVKGNFRDTVYSTSVYNYSRVELQSLLQTYTPNCFNLSDGAYIEGAKPTDVAVLNPFPLLSDKHGKLVKKLGECFKSKHIDKKIVDKKIVEYQKLFFDKVDVLKSLFEIEDLSFNEILLRFDILETSLMAIRLDDKVGYMLLNGSVRGLAYKLSVAKHNLNKDAFKQYYLIAKPLIDQFFEEMKNSIGKGFLKYDSYTVDS